MKRIALAVAFLCLAAPGHGQGTASDCRLDHPGLGRNMVAENACTALIDAPDTPPQQRADALHVRGEIRRRFNNIGGGWGDFIRLVELAPNDPRGYVGRGRFLERERHYRHALRDFDRAIAVDPTYAPAWQARGNFHSRRGNHAQAIADLDNAVRLDPTALRIWVDRGIAHDWEGDTDRALADFAEAIRRDPNYGPAWHSRGVTYHRMEDHVSALAAFRVAARLMPDDTEELNGLCFSIAFSGGDLNEARAACDEAFRRWRIPLYQANRGLVGLKQGRFQEAWADLNEALQDWTLRRDANALYGRGVAAIRLGRERSGRRDLSRALRWDPGVAAHFDRLGIGPPAGQRVAERVQIMDICRIQAEARRGRNRRVPGLVQVTAPVATEMHHGGYLISPGCRNWANLDQVGLGLPDGVETVPGYDMLRRSQTSEFAEANSGRMVHCVCIGRLRYQGGMPRLELTRVRRVWVRRSR